MAEEKPKTGPTWIHGNASNQQIDSSGEIVDLAGLDCSSLTQGCFNWEHQNSQPNQVVGKILEYKKIFSEADCENEHHKYFWNKCKVPYLYVMGRLFDDKKESSKEVAALFVDDAEHPDEPPMIGFSIEGSKISRTGITVDKSIARRVTCTGTPCNKACIAELVPNPDIKQQTDSDSIFKSEPAHTIELLSKAEKGVNTPMSSHIKGKDMKPGSKEMLGMSRMGNMAGGGYPEHAVSIAENKLDEIKRMPKPNLGKAEVPGSNIKPAHPAPTPSKAVKGAPGWSHTGGGNFHHPEHGTVSVIKEGSNFNVKHGGGLAGVAGKKGSFGSSKEAGAHAGDYMRSLGQGKTQAPAMHNRPSPAMAKGETGHEKGVATKPSPKFKEGVSTAGADVRLKDFGAAKKQAIGRMMEASKIKPKLAASEKSGNLKKGIVGGFGGMGGMNLPQESTDKKNSRGLFNPDVDKIQGRMGVMGGVGMGMGRSEKKGNLKKAMSAGSGMAGPGNLVQGAALAPESMGKKMKKSTWLARAEAEYSAWAKREQFENFMAKHMPDLAKHEIIAIGQTLALRKSLRAERKLSKMVDMGQDSWVKKKEK